MTVELSGTAGLSISDMKRKRKIKVLIDKGPFQFGHVLRFLSEKGIDIELFHSDHELRLFIDGKIKEFPMSNEKTA
ncbi:hypothetical protein NYZ99_09210 [Maribacter litopenaei]|uniref:Uncharacterized protein n=1 Tax=Maribacter litopenaei TaxID=2976127 RepID=A0ABY5YER4_9FLAO|nr:hypothetical protein [Maribacter litopenaei]UWX56356.1 hypothetical protein NYZ99_09210 [Maribacter litopenaei]